MTAILIYVAVWAAVAVAISLLLGRYLGRRPRSYPSPLSAVSGRSVVRAPARDSGRQTGSSAALEGTGARSGDGRGGSPRPALSRQDVPRPCGWWVGPVWKLDGETCVCRLVAPHPGPHECTCGASFEGCGHPPAEVQQ